MRTYICITAALGSLIAGPVLAQVDYQKAQQAGRVWQKKQLDNNRSGARTEANSRGVAYNAPVTDAEKQAFLAINRARYDRLRNSVGKKNADQWLEQMTRIERSKQ